MFFSVKMEPYCTMSSAFAAVINVQRNKKRLAALKSCYPDIVRSIYKNALYLELVMVMMVVVVEVLLVFAALVKDSFPR